VPIYQKIQQVMKAVKGVEKSETNRHANYKYAGHEAVTHALRDHFAELGIVRQASASNCQPLANGAVMITVHVTYTDVEDESFITLDMPAIQHSQTKSKEMTAQQIGQAVSYAVKNIEFKLFALTGDTEGDSDAGAPPDYYDNAPPPDWSHGGQTKAQPARSQQAAAQEQAQATGAVTVLFMNGESQQASNALEAAKMLAERMKLSDSWFHTEQMLGANDAWISKLPEKLGDRLREISQSKQDLAKSEGERLSGRTAA
jgi:hypothetical protein